MGREELHKLLANCISIRGGALYCALAKHGMPAGACPELWAAANPGILRETYLELIEVGEKFISTPTIEGNPLKLARYGLEAKCMELNAECVRIARAAAGDSYLVAAIIGPTGEQWEPISSDSLEEIITLYHEQVSGLLQGNPDFFLLEQFTNPAEARAAVIAIKELCSLPFIVNFSLESDGTPTDSSPEAIAVTFKSLGASAVNGTTAAQDESGTLLFSSLSNLAGISARGPICIIGERINPSGKAPLTAEIQNYNSEMALQLAQEQTNAGVHMLDVNAGAGGLDEAKALCMLVEEFSSSAHLPFAIDTPDPNAMVAALRLYCGRAMLNSINLSGNADRLFEAARLYGAAPVLMPLDGWSLPPTASGRRAIIERLLDKAQNFGYDKQNILIDCGTPCAAMCNSTAQEAIEFARQMHAEGYMTIAGISNVSYCLPRRQGLNAAYLAQLMSAGLSAAILNPTKPMMDMAAASAVLRGDDEFCQCYLQRNKKNKL